MNTMDIDISVQIIDLDDFSNLRPFMLYDARQNYDWFISNFEGSFDDLVGYILKWAGKDERHSSIDITDIDTLFGKMDNFEKMCRYFIDLGLCYEDMF